VPACERATTTGKGAGQAVDLGQSVVAAGEEHAVVTTATTNSPTKPTGMRLIAFRLPPINTETSVMQGQGYRAVEDPSDWVWHKCRTATVNN
jgi:hypothetical protein